MNQLQTTNGAEVKPFGEEKPQQQGGALAQVESSRAIQEVQAAMVIAQKFPRDEAAAYNRIMKSCERYSLAEKAMYAFPRGGSRVTGPSIHLAKAIAKAWGNLNYGIRELEANEGSSVVESYCWDLETNVKESKIFTVSHKRKANGQIKTLTDPRDIYEMVANQGSRRLRACILGVIPEDVVEATIKRAEKTLAGGNGGTPLVDRVRDMVAWFDKQGIPQDVLEKKLGHNVAAIDETELVELRKIANSLKDGMTKRSDWFDIGGPEGGFAAEMNADLDSVPAKADPPKSDEKTDKPSTKAEEKAPDAKKKGSVLRPKL